MMCCQSTLKVAFLKILTAIKGRLSLSSVGLLLALIVVVLWILVSLILLNRELSDGHRKERLKQDEAFKIRMGQSVETIDSYCRQLDRLDLLKQQRSYLLQKSDRDYEKEEAEAILLNARKEKLIRDNVLYIPDLSQMWCFVPKAASTTWSSIIVSRLKKMGQRNWSNISTSSTSSSLQVQLKEAFGHISKKEYDNAVHRSSIQRIVLVRHPFARIVSAFDDKLRNRKARSDGQYFYDQVGSMIHKKYRRNGKGNLRQEPLFTEFVEYLINEDPMDYDEHWKPISLLCGLCIVHYDVVIKVEDLPSTPSEALFRALNFSSGHIPWLNKIRKYSRNTSEYFSTIPRAKILRLYKKFETDFQLFGYKLGDY